jgi:molybdenum cofactor cytidylyltransferase
VTRVGAVVLAAGASTRLGEPKQLVMLGGETLLERAVRAAREAGCSPVVVVLGAEAEQILERTALGDAVTVVNDQWKEGMASSIRLGVQTLRSSTKDAEGVLLMACDQPSVTVEHLVHLISENEVRASRYAGKNGVPAFFPARLLDRLMELKGDTGARDLLAQAVSSDLRNGELDVDTAADLDRARQLYS